MVCVQRLLIYQYQSYNIQFDDEQGLWINNLYWQASLSSTYRYSYVELKGGWRIILDCARKARAKIPTPPLSDSASGHNFLFISFRWQIFRGGASPPWEAQLGQHSPSPPSHQFYTYGYYCCMRQTLSQKIFVTFYFEKLTKTDFWIFDWFEANKTDR